MSNTLTSTAPSAPLRIPRDTYKLKIQEEPEFKLSQKKNPMLVFKLELVEPEKKTIDGTEREIAGAEFTLWATQFEDKKTGQPVNPTLEAIHKACDIPWPPEIDPETGKPVGVSYTGLSFWALCSSEEKTQLNDEKQPIINPANGKPLTFFQRSVERVMVP